MTTRLTVRDRIILALLPAVLTSSVYLYGPGATVLARHKLAAAELQEAQSGRRSVTAVDSARDELEVVQLAAAQARTKAEALKQPLRGLPQGADGEALQLVSALFTARGMVLLKSERLQKSDELLPKNLREHWRASGTQFNLAPPQVWQFEFDGSYKAMAEACSELSDGKFSAVPLSVTMVPRPSPLTTNPSSLAPNPSPLDPNPSSLSPAPRPATQHWTLTVWL